MFRGWNPFARVDRQILLGTFEAAGSRDPDVLHARKFVNSPHR